MASEAENILIPFLGAFQASLAVLLTIAAGVVAAQFGLINEDASKQISRFCVRMSLPALLIVNVGSQLHLETGMRYVPIIVWALIYNALSMGLGFFLTKVVGMPDWVVPAIAFNNTTSLPLLLVQSLDATGILQSIDTSSDVIDRAKSYFLVNAMVGNSLTFALGPKLINGQEEDSPNDSEEKEDDPDARLEAQEREAEESNEETSLLPQSVVANGTRAEYSVLKRGEHGWRHLNPTVQSILHFSYAFLNAPIIGALIGALLGLVPALHRLFFSDQQHGGYLNAWLTSAIKNIGDLFAVLQVLVVGVKLSRAMLKMKKGEVSEESRVPWKAFMAVTIARFIMWPAISISIIYVLATRTAILSSDPILWFCMMLMPTGPPALKLIALADVNGAGEEEKMLIAKFLTMSYAISPLICFSVVGALRASEAAVGA